jgi:hypothetical protein
LNYRTSTNQPSVQQLQNVINNSDPIRLSTGNPNLEQEFYHNIFGRYSTANPFEGTSFFAMMFAQFGINKISNSTFIAQRDTLLNGDVPMGRGAQLNLPINMDGYFSARSFAVYSFPFDFIKSNVNVNAAVNYSRELTRINSDTNTATNLAFEQGIGINSNISPDLDFSINARLGMNFVRNSLRSELDNNFFTQTYNVRANYVFWEGFSVGTELAVTINSGLTEEFNQTIPFWNLNIGKQLFNRAAEIKLTVFDVLRENNSIRREVTPTYIQDTQTNVLQQYALLTFTYYIRSFGG